MPGPGSDGLPRTCPSWGSTLAILLLYWNSELAGLVVEGFILEIQHSEIYKLLDSEIKVLHSQATIPPAVNTFNTESCPFVEFT